MGEINLLLRIFDAAYSKRSWHGTNLRGSLRGMTAQEAMWRPSPGRHNAWELMLHAAYWKYIVRRRLLGSDRGSFALKGSDWFDREGRLEEEQWKQELEILENEHLALRQAIAELKPADLTVFVRGSKNDNATMIYGVAAHDLYHAGQIQLIKRLR